MNTLTKTKVSTRVNPRHSGSRSASPTRQEPPARPDLSLLGSEPWRAAAEYVCHVLKRKPSAADGDGHPVIIFPGLASDGRAVAPLRKHCARLGYEAMDWGRGMNLGPKGDLDDWLHTLGEEMRARLGAGAPPPTLIGWSLGGLYARELAKTGWPVRQVITIGTPFNGTAEQTHAGGVYRWLNGAPALFDATLQSRLRAAPPVPTTSLYSRSDGIVAWRACLHDRQGPQVQDIEIGGSHLGMGWNARVLRIVGDRLAQPDGQWQRLVDDQPAQAHPLPTSKRRAVGQRSLSGLRSASTQS